MSSRQDFDGVETEYHRDGRGFVAEETLVPLSASRSYVRDAAGRVTSYTDRDDVVTEAIFTRAGLPDTISRPRASAADWTLAWYLYEDDGLPSMASEGGVTRAFSYDTLRRLSWSCDGYASGGCARDTQFTYDDEDRVTTATIQAGGGTLATSFQYDGIGNLVGVTHPGGSTETWGYTRAGQVGAHRDEEMVGSAWGYDDLGRMAWEDLPGQDPRSWSYTHGVPSGTSGVYYTETRRDEPDGGSWFTLHDFAGRAVYQEDPYGDAVTREYSGTRLEHAHWTSSTGTTLAHEAYGYGRPAGDVERAARALRAHRATSPVANATRPRSRARSEARGVAGGRLAYRLGPVDDATHAALGSATPDPAAGDYAFAYAYTDEGNLRSREGPNDLTEWGWEDGVVTSEDAAGVTATTYAYDPDLPRLYSRSAGDGASNARVTTYARDALGRLESATTADGSQEVVASWLDRDAYGRPRLSRREVDGVVESARTVTTDPRGRVSTLSLATPTRSAGVSYQYYDNGQLYAMEAGWSGGGSASLTYTRGPGGEAIEVEDLGTGDLRSFLWGPSEADFPVGILDGRPPGRRGARRSRDSQRADHLYVAAEGMVLGRMEGAAFTPMGQDGQGSVVLDGIDLLPEPGAFGETPAPASPERRVYALLESLPGTSYHLPRHRLYDSDTGRFASADPSGSSGATTGSCTWLGIPSRGWIRAGSAGMAVQPRRAAAMTTTADHPAGAPRAAGAAGSVPAAAAGSSAAASWGQRARGPFRPPTAGTRPRAPSPARIPTPPRRRRRPTPGRARGATRARTRTSPVARTATRSFPARRAPSRTRAGPPSP